MKSVEDISNILGPILSRYNAELVEINLGKSPKSPLLQILVDKDGGITLDECAAISKELGNELDNDAGMQKSYTLEVSSPGLDRPLKAKRDFEKIRGERVNVYMKEPVNGTTFIQAAVDSADDECINLRLKDGNLARVPYAKINKATLEIKY